MVEKAPLKIGLGTPKLFKPTLNKWKHNHKKLRF
jgi:hypothetical protein